MKEMREEVRQEMNNMKVDFEKKMFRTVDSIMQQNKEMIKDETMEMEVMFHSIMEKLSQHRKEKQ